MSYAKYGEAAVAAARKYGIDPGVYIRQIGQESSWNPNAVSSAGARGIAQFMPATAKGMGVNPDDPLASLDAGARLMRQNLDMFGNYPDALAAYNAGPGAVQKYGGVPPFAETRQYVATILGETGGSGGYDAFGNPFKKKPKEVQYDPNDPETWSGDQRSQFLGAAGFKHITGNGTSAVWQAPDGRRVTESNAFDLLLGYTDEKKGFVGPDAPKPAADPKASGAPDLRYDADGNAYEWDGSDWQPADKFSNYTKAAGYVAPKAGPSELDWAKENREAGNVTYNREQDRIARERQDRLDAASLKKYTDDVAREDVKLRILTEQNKIANDRDNRTEQREIARDIENAQNRRDQASARVSELNMAALNRAAEFNASATETAAQRQEAHRATTIAGQRQNAVDIAGFQQMPGDVGMLGAYLAARTGDGGSTVSTAIGQGETFITDRSLAPLGSLLDVRSELSRPVTFGAARYDPAILAQPPQQAPGIFNRNAPNGMPAPEPEPTPGFSAIPGPAVTFDPQANGGQGGWSQNGQPVDAFEAAAANIAAASAPAAAPQAAPQSAPSTQQASQPIFSREAAYQPMTTTYGAPTQANPGARIFQRDAAAMARDRSGLRGDLTPIAYSDPGTNPYLAELAASVTAAERGVDRKLFERERQRLAPRRQPVFSRTR